MTDHELLRLCLPFVSDELAAEIHKALERPQKRATRLPEGWRPDSMLITWAKAERPDVDPVKQVGSFADYWHGKAGKDGCKLDWNATYRNWIRNCRSDPKPAYVPEPKSPSVSTIVQRRKVDTTPNPRVQEMMAELAAKMRINLGGGA